MSYGRNAGLRAARAPILAFTDDDVIASPDWVANIKRAFDENPGTDYLNGKILPLYGGPSSAWLTAANSGPCTIRDRGEERLFGRPGCFFPNWATANLAFRRTVFDRVGGFAEDFERGEDLEFIVRVWRAGCAGMYTPDVVVSHKIPRERMTKAYHRMWHTREGEIRGQDPLQGDLRRGWPCARHAAVADVLRHLSGRLSRAGRPHRPVVGRAHPARRGADVLP